MKGRQVFLLVVDGNDDVEFQDIMPSRKRFWTQINTDEHRLKFHPKSFSTQFIG